MVYGNSLKNCAVAIIAPDESFVNLWGTANGKELSLTTADANSDFKQAIMDDMNRLAVENKLSSLERPKAIYLTPDPFSVENDILTPTMKIKRNVGQKVYQIQIDEMYKTLERNGI